MALHDAIALEIQAGALAPQFRAADLKTAERRVYRNLSDSKERYRVGLDFFAASTITTQLANLCEETGYWARNGQPAQYRRIAEGTYELLSLSEAAELAATTKANDEMAAPDDYRDLTPWEARFAFYVEREPFQIYDRRRRKTYPAQAVCGLDARLNSYFWPSPEEGFAATEQVLQGYIDRAQVIGADLAGNADAVLALFESICQWGGVRLPTQDPEAVVANLQRAAKRDPRQPAAMNSAWTKLYAMFYPDNFVIYDSRVATALVAIAEAVLADTELQDFKTQYPNLGVIVGRGGTRPRSTGSVWGNAYLSWPAQLNANRLVAAIVQAVNARSGLTYSIRQVEAMLFMEGY